ncbi:MAG TPA: hypothetical protein VH024_17375 [Candidatus Angelobacter sp.]|jgi:hypothetical protein|nr:hypothetical protein [Candidatus Angelobacter sp.]
MTQNDGWIGPAPRIVSDEVAHTLVEGVIMIAKRHGWLDQDRNIFDWLEARLSGNKAITDTTDEAAEFMEKSLKALEESLARHGLSWEQYMRCARRHFEEQMKREENQSDR